MGKILSIIAALFMAVTTVTVAKAGDLSEILADGVVKIAVPESFAPFGSVGATGEHEGYDVDVAKLIAEDLGVKLELVPVVSKQRIPFLETDRVDLVVSVMGAIQNVRNRSTFPAHMHLFTLARLHRRHSTFPRLPTSAA